MKSRTRTVFFPNSIIASSFQISEILKKDLKRQKQRIGRVGMQYDFPKWLRVIQGFLEESKVTWKLDYREIELKNK